MHPPARSKSRNIATVAFTECTKTHREIGVFVISFSLGEGEFRGFKPPKTRVNTPFCCGRHLSFSVTCSLRYGNGDGSTTTERLLGWAIIATINCPSGRPFSGKSSSDAFAGSGHENVDTTSMVSYHAGTTAAVIIPSRRPKR